MALLRRVAIRARTLLDTLAAEAPAALAAPPVEGDEPSAFQRRVWALHFDLDVALMHAMPERDPWYQGPECQEIEALLERLERLVDDRLALLSHRLSPGR